MTDANQVAKALIKTFKSGGKLLIGGNGGSSAQASHFAAELVNKMSTYRKPLPAIPLTDMAIITSIANDMGYEYIFSRQIEAFAMKGDCVILLSTTAKSKNIMQGNKTAKELGLQVIQFPTNKELGTTTPVTQEIHLQMIHDISDQIEKAYL